MKKECYIVDAIRTPIGSFGGAFSSIDAIELAAVTVRKLAERFSNKKENKHLLKDNVDEFILGNVIATCLGQAPARQVVMKSSFPSNVRGMTVNKVCGSGMEAIRLGANAIYLCEADSLICGGTESMSNYPYVLKGGRFGWRMGHSQVLDLILADALTDPYSQKHMGQITSALAEKYKITKEEQDKYAIESYKRSLAAIKEDLFKDEIAPVEVKQKKQLITIENDEEPGKGNIDKLPNLRAIFGKEGGITAGNASSINDGAATCLLMSEDKVKKMEVKPRAKILGFSSYSGDPDLFAITPIHGIKMLWDKLGMKKEDFDLYEINEAFSASSLIILKELGLDQEKVNVNGGAVALGHPIGASGARIIVTLLNSLEKRNLKRGIASLCIGSGEALSIAIELVN